MWPGITTEITRGDAVFTNLCNRVVLIEFVARTAIGVHVREKANDGSGACRYIDDAILVCGHCDGANLIFTEGNVQFFVQDGAIVSCINNLDGYVWRVIKLSIVDDEVLATIETACENEPICFCSIDQLAILWCISNLITPGNREGYLVSIVIDHRNAVVLGEMAANSNQPSRSRRAALQLGETEKRPWLLCGDWQDANCAAEKRHRRYATEEHLLILRSLKQRVFLWSADHLVKGGSGGDHRVDAVLLLDGEVDQVR